MFTNILVPLDGTPLAETALRPAALLGQRFGSRLILLVRSIDTWPTQEQPTPPGPVSAIISTEAYLTTVAKRVTEWGLTVQTLISDERPAHGISAEAAYHQADLIVMTTHGRQGLESLLHPSVTWEVLRQTRAPILTWKVSETTGQLPDSSWVPPFLQDATLPILIPLDGSLLAEQVLPLAEQIGQRLGNPLVLVRAAEQPFIAGTAIDYPAVLAREQEWSLGEATSYLERKRLEVSSTGLHIEVDAQPGDAATIIAESVQNHHAGLVVMASHGRSGLGRLLLGSVARSLLHRLEVPILLVRPHPGKPARASSQGRRPRLKEIPPPLSGD